MENNSLILRNELFGSIKESWSPSEFRFAIERFRENAPGIPVPRLYDAYRWVKEQVDVTDDAINKQFFIFNEIFLRELEGRGEHNTEIYSTVLRDSSEYKYLRELFYREPPVQEEPEPVAVEDLIVPEKPAKRLTLKELISSSNASLLGIDIESWRKLVDEHFISIRDEDLFVKESSGVMNRITKIISREPYHLEIMIIYSFEKLLLHKKLSVKTKDYAMKLLNMAADNKSLWSILHREYLEIIRK
jgi:hypothetical protein